MKNKYVITIHFLTPNCSVVSELNQEQFDDLTSLLYDNEIFMFRMGGDFFPKTSIRCIQVKEVKDEHE